MKSYLSPVLALVLALSISSCSSPRFQREWKTTAAAPETTAPKNVEGAWQGTWKSEATGHQGTLKAVATALDQDSTYAFQYRATWRNFLSATFESEHTVKLRGKDFVLTGQHNLGPMFGGVYHYNGTVTPTTFKCRYRNKLDHGIFEMQRP